MSTARSSTLASTMTLLADSREKSGLHHPDYLFIANSSEKLPYLAHYEQLIGYFKDFFRFANKYEVRACNWKWEEPVLLCREAFLFLLWLRCREFLCQYCIKSFVPSSWLFSSPSCVSFSSASYYYSGYFCMVSIILKLKFFNIQKSFIIGLPETMYNEVLQ